MTLRRTRVAVNARRPPPFAVTPASVHASVMPPPGRSSAARVDPATPPTVESALAEKRARQDAAWARYLAWATDGKGITDDEVAAAARELDLDGD